MKNSYKTLAFALLASFLFAHCSADKQRNRDIPYNDLETVMTNLSPLPQSFEIDPTEDNQIKGEKGTVVFIPADAFRFEDGSVPTEEVQVELKESYTLTEMIGAGLHTMSGDRPLETAGMIYVNATADGKPLKVQGGKAFVVSFPKNQQTEEMDLFYSLALKDSVETWVVDYEVFGVEARLAAMKDTVRSDADTAVVGYFDKYQNGDIQSVYPFELTEDLYNYVFEVSTLLYNQSSWLESPIQGYGGMIWKYLSDPSNVDSTISKDFCENGWQAYIEFKVDKNGKMNSFKPLFSNERYWPKEMTKEAYAEGVKLLESMPPYDLANYDNYIPKKGAHYNIIIGCAHKLNQDRYKQKFRNQYAEYQDKAIEKIDQAELNYYTFSVTKFGWINCDRFLDMDASELTNFAVNTASPNTSTVSLVFKDLNNIMEGSYEDGKIVFANLPKGKAVKLVGISYANGKPMMATAETVIGEKGFELTGYKPFTLDEMEAALNN
jgi:hypothetical protein